MDGVIAFIIGACIGSFLNVAADRVPNGKSLVRPRSSCDQCGQQLRSIDMVPLLSYLWLRGRCRHCRTSIPVRVFLVEAVTGALFAVVFYRYGFGADFVVLSTAVPLMVVVTLVDLEHGLILNAMVYPSVVILLLLAPFWPELGIARGFSGNETLAASLANSFLAGLGGFLIFLVIAIISPAGMGGGDGKFAGLLGLLLGFPGVLLALWISVITGGVMAISLLLLHKKGRKDSMPFGPFMAMGGTVIFIAGDDFLDWYRELSEALSGSLA